MVQDENAAALERLADALPGGAYVTVLTAGRGREPKLTVVSRRVPQLSGDIYAVGGWYWWSWAERITGTSDHSRAAAIVAGTLDATVPAS
jgi:hypothetical protein